MSAPAARAEAMAAAAKVMAERRGRRNDAMRRAFIDSARAERR